MDKAPISKQTLEKLKEKARANLQASSLKDQVQDEHLLEESDIQKIGQLKQEGLRHTEIADAVGVSVAVVKSTLKKNFPLQSGVTRFPFKKKG